MWNFRGVKWEKKKKNNSQTNDFVQKHVVGIKNCGARHTLNGLKGDTVRILA
jgi:hypothetical protein